MTEDARAAWTELTYVDPAEREQCMCEDHVSDTDCPVVHHREEPPAPEYNRTMAPIRVEWVDGVGKHHYVYADNALTAISLSQSLGVDTFVHNVLITAHDPGVRIIDVDLDTP
jgi:hypothetical protein